MIEVRYQREVAYPTDRVLSQYFDFEHLEHVHPRTFGRARLLSQHDNTVVWELEWPSMLGMITLRSSFRQEYIPPFGIRSVIVKGLLKGTESEVQLGNTGEGTLVEELHRVALPDWWWLRNLIRRSWSRRLDRIWEEDLSVGVCHGGWPGVPRTGTPQPG
jgi:hypothetical protein